MSIYMRVFHYNPRFQTQAGGAGPQRVVGGVAERRANRARQILEVFGQKLTQVSASVGQSTYQTNQWTQPLSRGNDPEDKVPRNTTGRRRHQGSYGSDTAVILTESAKNPTSNSVDAASACQPKRSCQRQMIIGDKLF
jgi:hypothetical protein